MGKITNLIIGLILIAVFFTGITIFLAGVQDKYSFTTDDNMSEVYRYVNITYVTGESSDIHAVANASLSGDSLIPPSTPLSWYNYADWAFKSFISSIKLTASSGVVANNMMNAAGETLGIAWVTGAIAAIISITVLFMIISWLTGRDT